MAIQTVPQERAAPAREGMGGRDRTGDEVAVMAGSIFESFAQKEWLRCQELYRAAPHGRKRAAERRLRLATFMLLMEEQRGH